VDELKRLGELPGWLAELSQQESVRGALVRNIPEFTSGALRLEAVEGERLRIKSDSWTVTYDLTVDGDGRGRRTVKVRGGVYVAGAPELTRAPSEAPLGSPEWRRVLPELGMVLEASPTDEGLPALPILTDPDRARELLESGIRSCSPAYGDIRIKACAPKVARYKPGSRCTIVYRLDFAAEDADRGWPDLVVAKTYHGEKGKNAWDGMRALWDSPLGVSAAVKVAEPLAFLPDVNVLVQGPVREERILKDLLTEAIETGSPATLAEYREFQAKTVAGLVVLHTCGVGYGQTITWADEVAEIRGVLDRLTKWVPAVGDAAEPLLGRLEALASEHPAQTAGPAHRSFRPAQVLISGQGIGFIDFDGFCQCEPAIDVALFRATIKDIGMRAALERTREGGSPRDTLIELAPTLDQLCEKFFEDYESRAHLSRERVALWEALDLLTNVLHNWTKVRPERMEGSMILLERHLRDSDLLPT
jgi:hypothetical protein